MVNNCGACTKTIRSTQHLQCSKCANYFHAVCVNLTDLRKLPEEVKSAWTCPLCQGKEPRKDNTNTPVRAAAATGAATTSAALGDDRANVISREGSRKLNIPTPTLSSSTILSPNADPMGMIASEMKLMREDMGDMKSHMKSLAEHIASCLDEYGTKFRLLEEREAARDEEIALLKTTVTHLQEQLNSRAQANLRNEIEILGITETASENPLHIISVTAQKIGVTVDDRDLDYAMRVGPRRPEADVASSKSARPLVVRFVQRQKREEFLKAAKSRRNLSCADIGVEGASKKLYFNERLTQEIRQLFRTTRQRSKEAGYKYCWTKNGTIHLRREEGCPAIAIKSPEDLERRLVSASAQMLQPEST